MTDISDEVLDSVDGCWSFVGRTGLVAVHSVLFLKLSVALRIPSIIFRQRFSLSLQAIRRGMAAEFRIHLERRAAMWFSWNLAADVGVKCRKRKAVELFS
jgi:hypothetical protein